MKGVLLQMVNVSHLSNLIIANTSHCLGPRPHKATHIIINAKNQDDIVATEIEVFKSIHIYQSTKQRPCTNADSSTLTKCYDLKLREIFGANLCMTPFLSSLLSNHEEVRQCNSSEEAKSLEAESIIKLSHLVQQDACPRPCHHIEYEASIHEYGANAFRGLLPDEKTNRSGYHQVWVVYSTMNVQTTTEEFVYNFETALVNLGGSMGLFLGLSCNFMIIFLFNLIGLCSNKICS